MNDSRGLPTAMDEENKFSDEVRTVSESIGNSSTNRIEDRCTRAPLAALGDSGDAAPNQVSPTLGSEDNAAPSFGPPTVRKKERADRPEEIRGRYDELRRRWSEQRDELGRAQDEIVALRNQIMHQSTFCASLGAVLGNLVWRASRFPRVVDTWLSRTKLGEFLCIANGTFVSFINTYGSAFPSENSDESQFVMGVCGIATNLSASPKGRQFLVTHSNGKELLEKIVKLMPLVPLPAGQSLASLMLMILYNCSINEDGVRYMIELRVCRVLGRYMDDPASAQLRQLSLRLLRSVASELRDESTVEDILRILTTSGRIEDVALAESDAVAAEIKEVLANLGRSRSFLEERDRRRRREGSDSQKNEAKSHLTESLYARSNSSTRNSNTHKQ